MANGADREAQGPGYQVEQMRCHDSESLPDHRLDKQRSWDTRGVWVAVAVLAIAVIVLYVLFVRQDREMATLTSNTRLQVVNAAPDAQSAGGATVAELQAIVNSLKKELAALDGLRTAVVTATNRMDSLDDAVNAATNRIDRLNTTQQASTNVVDSLKDTVNAAVNRIDNLSIIQEAATNVTDSLSNTVNAAANRIERLNTTQQAATNVVDSLKDAVFNTATSLLQYQDMLWAGEHLGVAFPTVVGTANAQYYIKGWGGTDGVVFEAHFGGGAEYGLRCSLINAAALLACVGRRVDVYTGTVTMATSAGGGFEASVTVDASGVKLAAGDHRASGQFHLEKPPSSVVGEAAAGGVMEQAWRWGSAADVPDRRLYSVASGLVMFGGVPMASGVQTVGSTDSNATFAGDWCFPVYAVAAKQRGETNVGVMWDAGAVYSVPTLSDPTMEGAWSKAVGFVTEPQLVPLRDAVHNTATSLLQYKDMLWAGEHLGVAFPTVVGTANAQYYFKGWGGTDGVVFEAHFGGGAEWGVRCSLINAAAQLDCVGRRGDAYTGAVSMATKGRAFEASVTVDASGVMLVAGSHRASGQFHLKQPPSSVVGEAAAVGVMEQALKWGSAADVPDQTLRVLRTGVIMYGGVPMASTETVGPAGTDATFAGDVYFPVYAAVVKQRGETNVGVRWDAGAVYNVPRLSDPTMNQKCAVTVHESVFPNHWQTNWDAFFAAECPPNYVLTGIASQHDNHREDRLFKFKCSPMTCVF